MSQIRTSALALATLLSLLPLALSGCGDKNSQANLVPGTGQHLANWLPAGHTQTAKANIAACTGCHGQDLQGGIVKVSCTRCHLGNALSIHPLLWGNFAYAFHADYVNQAKSATDPYGSAKCANANCHGTDLLGVANSGPSCGINCHMAGTAQAPQKHAWTAITAADNIVGHIAYFTAPGATFNYTLCRNAACHGGLGNKTTPPPGVFLSGPGCVSNGCHTGFGVPGNPLPAEI